MFSFYTQDDMECPLDHLNYEGYVKEENPSYFNTKWASDNPWYPKKCVECNIVFGTEYKVGAKCVRMCLNANRSYHPCQHAMCQPCYEGKVYLTRSGGNSRKRRRRVDSKYAKK